MNHQAQILFTTAEESRCIKFSRAVTEYSQDFQSTALDSVQDPVLCL